MALNATELQTPEWLNSGDNAWQMTWVFLHKIDTTLTDIL